MSVLGGHPLFTGHYTNSIPRGCPLNTGFTVEVNWANQMTARTTSCATLRASFVICIDIFLEDL